MEDICPYGNNLPYEGVYGPVYYFYQAPLFLLGQIAFPLTPVVEAMSEAWPILAIAVELMLIQAKMSVLEKLLAYMGISWVIVYGFTHFHWGGLEAFLATLNLLTDGQSISVNIFDLLVRFAVTAPLALNTLLSWRLIDVFSCKEFTYLLSAWAIYAVYETLYQDVEMGLMMWLNGAFAFNVYTIYTIPLDG